jgi:hypothetical protein
MTSTTKHLFRYIDQWIYPDQIVFGSADVVQETRGSAETPEQRNDRLDQYDEFVGWLNGGALNAARIVAAQQRPTEVGVMVVLYEDDYGVVYASPQHTDGKVATLRVVAVNT